METWTGKRLRPEQANELSGIKTIRYIEDFDSLLSQVIYDAGSVFLNIPEIPKFSTEVRTMDKRMADELHKRFPAHDFKRLSPLLRELRVKKEEEEIECIKTASEITGEAFHRVLRTLKPGMNEKEIEAEISYEFIKNNARHAYPPIIGSGINATILHYIENRSICADGDLLLMDFGAEFNNYGADCSRTIPVNGRFSPRQAALYDGLHIIFKRAISLMIPGSSMKEVHTEIVGMMKKYHVDNGLYSMKDLKDKKGPEAPWFKYYMHGSGHSLGLDVHDFYDKNAKFEPGMVFTCEPGIYIEEESLGIRIENDILITESGNIDLMDHIPSSREEIESLMNSK
jgi:Xaa-Pro aminopeptidase